nr:hypothetical protein BaRGS_004264 [Batillaria attramentaria]
MCVSDLGVGICWLNTDILFPVYTGLVTTPNRRYTEKEVVKFGNEKYSHTSKRTFYNKATGVFTNGEHGNNIYIVCLRPDPTTSGEDLDRLLSLKLHSSNSSSPVSKFEVRTRCGVPTGFCGAVLLSENEQLKVFAGDKRFVKYASLFSIALFDP